MGMDVMARNLQVKIKNYTGIPILDIVGELNAAAVNQIANQVQRLVDAGHYHIVFDLKEAAFAGLKGLRAVNEIARGVKRHYGSLYLIADQGQEEELRQLPLGEGARICRSVEHAIAKILGGYYRPLFGKRAVSARLEQ
jgi:anti-anti-sigma factor